jgi:hypothetical protein
VIRVPRKLYERIRDRQGATLHETIERAMDAREDPRGDRRIRELQGALDAARADVLRLEKRVRALVTANLAQPITSAGSRTLALFPKAKGDR